MRHFLPALAPVLLCALASCAGPGMPQTASDVQYAPPSRVVAELPADITGGSRMQDHNGPAVWFGAAPPINDTGSERIPNFPTGAEPPVAQAADAVIMPNGGNRPVESVNSLASPP